MFDLSLMDTLRLGFGQVVYHHKSHSRAASSLARYSRYFRVAETLLMMTVVMTATAGAFGRGHGFTIAASVLASLALLAFLIHLTFDFESSARAHHVCSTRLWHVREQYRSLLSDLTDGAIDPELARTRRNALMEEVTGIYESAPPLTRRVFQKARTEADTSEESALADAEIDRFLPKSLHGVKRVESPSSV
jgi:SMODS and SLOG-associating 2TM effector domain family 4